MIGNAGARQRSRAARGKSPKKGNGNLATLRVVAAHAKLTYARETRLLALLTFGESLEASCRAIDISSTAIRKRMQRDPAFAQRLTVAREHRVHANSTTVEIDWREAAARLEASDPLHWALPGNGADAFNFDPPA
jgi:hypothetical protein